MDILELSKVAAALLAISLATERLVAIVKTLSPEWFAIEARTNAKEVDLGADRLRRLRVQLIAFLAAWLTSALLASGGWPPHFLGSLKVGTGSLAVWLVAFLATGGSAFWAQVVGYTSALKDIAVTDRARTSLDYTEKAHSMGRSPQDSGVAVSSRLAQRRTLANKLDQATPALQ